MKTWYNETRNKEIQKKNLGNLTHTQPKNKVG